VQLLRRASAVFNFTLASLSYDLQARHTFSCSVISFYTAMRGLCSRLKA
jgi:hypothetical protein